MKPPRALIFGIQFTENLEQRTYDKHTDNTQVLTLPAIGHGI
jgi:hypothetical protein